MKNKNYIGICQRIPLVILEDTLLQFLATGKLDKNIIMEKLSVFFKGENRKLKAYSIIKKLFLDNTDLKKMGSFLTPEIFKSLEKFEQQALLLAIIGSKYPFAFNLIKHLSSLFKVQETCNIKFIYNKMSSYYGSNRSTSVAIYTLIPLLIEMNLLKRVKPGLYILDNTFVLKNKTVMEYFLLAYFINNKTKSLLFEDLHTNPWFFFFKLDSNVLDDNSFKNLTVSKNESKNYIFLVV